jgi:hypothetical protein
LSSEYAGTWGTKAKASSTRYNSASKTDLEEQTDGPKSPDFWIEVS